MEKDRFSDFVTELAYHFGQDKFVVPGPATQKRLSSWYRQISHLPSEPLEWMSNTIKNNSDYFPRNLSKLMLSLYDQWLKNHPEKQVQRGVCHYCMEGWILAQPADEPFLRSVACGHCDRPTPKGIWKATTREIEARGWTVKHRQEPPAVSETAKTYLEHAMGKE